MNKLKLLGILYIASSCLRAMEYEERDFKERYECAFICAKIKKTTEKQINPHPIYFYSEKEESGYLPKILDREDLILSFKTKEGPRYVFLQIKINQYYLMLINAKNGFFKFKKKEDKLFSSGPFIECKLFSIDSLKHLIIFNAQMKKIWQTGINKENSNAESHIKVLHSLCFYEIF
jgi:hypothetical protein